MMIRTLSRTWALALVMPGAANACAREEPFAPSDLALDQLVFRAEVTDYALNQRQGRLTLRRVEGLAGDVPATLTVFWDVLMGDAPPETWDRSHAVIVGVIANETGAFWQLVNPPCGTAHILPDTPENGALVRAALPPPVAD